MRRALGELTAAQLRRWLLIFFIALALPTAVLIAKAYSQLKWEAYHQHRLMAEELAERIRSRISAAIATEEARGFADYAFLVVAGDPATNYVERSALSAFPIKSALPGTIGYFQVDTDGTLTTPLLPQPGTDAGAFGIGGRELSQREQRVTEIQNILTSNRLVRSTPPADEGAGAAVALDDSAAEAAPVPKKQASADSANEFASDKESAVPAQAAFDRLKTPAPASKVMRKQKSAADVAQADALKQEKHVRSEQAEQALAEEDTVSRSAAPIRSGRRELSAIPELTQNVPESMTSGNAVATTLPTQIRVRTFESDIDPFEFSQLASGHFVLFRKVWRDGQRYIQGILIEHDAFLNGMIEQPFRATALAQMSDLSVALQGNVVADFIGRRQRSSTSDETLRGTSLLNAQLNAPLSDMHLLFTLNRLPAGPGSTLITWVALILVLVLTGGFVLMYRLSISQIHLARQQQDFVSAVSHELKTPLTSIRMYGEMLREGWAPDEKKSEYYNYIHDESERLSRLINNVLQLARMTRNDLQVQLASVGISELIDVVRSKISSHVERAGFELSIDCPAGVQQRHLMVDQDYFSQIVINLVDNAIKFSSKAERRAIGIGCRETHEGTVVFSVRDYGPGIAKDQLKKVFRLFYRSENELTRETVGTGIGLALVNQLTIAMNGKVDVVNVEPGAEFRLTFPVAD